MTVTRLLSVTECARTVSLPFIMQRSAVSARQWPCWAAVRSDGRVDAASMHARLSFSDGQTRTVAAGIDRLDQRSRSLPVANKSLPYLSSEKWIEISNVADRKFRARGASHCQATAKASQPSHRHHWLPATLTQSFCHYNLGGDSPTVPYSSSLNDIEARDWDCFPDSILTTLCCSVLPDHHSSPPVYWESLNKWMNMSICIARN